ncbi:class I SAM-dependent methyltransferase [Desulfovibrio gilichinskyi]|uniref:Methyltransferase domain-containing protein n=1 Tax=Desulfovibrio gilichinskyi TaxID=1519643 RepID=A0A1X7E1N7_9BACT|nr:class I SAM-dependent methyltransferase [Desulfovibrio gilichinskyi]SMF25171.1 Methyltransferase domain-containing protein [Desulfovibrio gilichinskyi]
MINNLIRLVNSPVSSASLWNSAYKIPWNDPVFSARILREHLSQNHQLASRKTGVIDAQVKWISDNFLNCSSMNILDLGCGPGLYSRKLTAGLHQYTGFDFSPASIQYAQHEYAIKGQCEFILGDILEVDFGANYDLAMMIYGEVNVFSPRNCRHILSKAYEALALRGTLLIEVQSFDAIERMAQSPNTWSSAEAGLFTESPHICLTENRWFADETTSFQQFHVITGDGDDHVTYRSTTKAWTEDEFETLLRSAGFVGVRKHTEWPNANSDLILFSATKS